MTNEKKISWRVLCCLLFSLILAVAGREAAEFVNLTDDVPKDGMVVSSSIQRVFSQISSRRVIPHEESGTETTDRVPSKASRALIRFRCFPYEQGKNHCVWSPCRANDPPKTQIEPRNSRDVST